MEIQLNSKSKKQRVNEYETFVRMSWKNDPELVDEAKKAFNELYDNHKEYVLAVLRKVCRHLPYASKDEIVKELFNDTFKRIYDKAETISAALEQYEQTNPDEFRRILRSYIGKIAKNETIRYQKGESAYHENHQRLEDNGSIEPFDVPDFEDPDDEPQENQTEINKWTEYAFAQLKPIEQDILRTTFMYHQPGKDLPDSVKQEICARHCITSGNMRVIKSRAIKKFESIMAEKSGLQPLRLQQEKTGNQIPVRKI